jgi:hypothetical protein
MHTLRNILGRMAVILALAVPAYQAQALDSTTLTTELQTLTVQGNSLLAATSTTVLIPLTATSQMDMLAVSYNDYLTSVQTTYDMVLQNSTSSMVVTDDLLQAFQSLTATQAGLATASTALAGQLVPLADGTMSNSFYSMLQLSNDIGAMADRIGEMADRILLMADNIGLMADRILATQLIQSANLDLTYDAILETQKNMIMLFSLYQ